MASGNSSLHASCEGPLRIPLQPLLGSGSSSGVEAGISGLLSSADIDLGAPLEFPQGSQASSQVKTCKSIFLSSWKSSVWLPVDLTYGLVAFSRGATGISHVPSCCEYRLGVTVKSVQGNQVYLKWVETSGCYGMVAQPLDFLSRLKLRPPSLEV